MSFSLANPPKRAGDYSRFIVQRATTLPPSTGAILAVPFVDDWGPLETPVLLQSFAEYIAVFGTPINPAAPSPGYVAVYNAFKGNGPGAPGAGAVLAYRMGAAAAAKATKALVAGATNPAITLTARYEGARGNQLKVEVVATATDLTNKRDVNIYDGNTLIESYGGYGQADIVQLAADINARSEWVTASGGVNGTKLDVAAAAAMATGNSGQTLLSSDWTDALANIEPQAFAYFAPYDVTDSSIVASLVSWCAAKNAAEKSKRFTLVHGGALNESFSTAVTRSAAANNENIVNVGVGSYRETALDLVLSTSQLATRLAGILSRLGGGASLSFNYLSDLEIVVGPSESDLLASIDAGVVLIAQGTAGPRFEKGVTTYVTKTNADKPFDTFSRIKYVATMQGFERDNREANENGQVLGRLAVNNDTREELVSSAQKRLDIRIANKEVQPGARVGIAADPPPSDDDEFVHLEWLGKFSRSLEQVRNSFYLS